MKKYKVKVNGKVYEVELEAVEEVKGSVQAPVAQSTPVTTSVSGDSKPVLAPIAGKVLSVAVKVGDAVKKGDTICVIEAMKLENPVKAAFDGVVKDVRVSAGNMVANKDVLAVLA